MHKSILASASHTSVWQALITTLTPGHHTSPVLELHRLHSADAVRHHYHSKFRHSCMQLVWTALSWTTFINMLRNPSLSSRLMHAVSSHPDQHCLSGSSYQQAGSSFKEPQSLYVSGSVLVIPVRGSLTMSSQGLWPSSSSL